MSATESGIKGTLAVGLGTPSALAFGTIPPGPDNQALVTDSTQPQGIKWVPFAALVDPRDIMRFSMLNNIMAGGNG
jgi:hypothetical protein